jgi:hypothetical protein
MTSPKIGWRIYVDHSDYQKRSVDRRCRALGECCAGADAVNHAADAVANAVDAIAFDDHQLERDDHDRSGDEHVRIAGDDYRLRAASHCQQHQRGWGLRPAQWPHQGLVVEQQHEPELREPIRIRQLVIDNGRARVPVDGRVVERAARRSRRSSGGSDGDLRQSVDIVHVQYHDDREPVRDWHVECVARTARQHAAGTGHECGGDDHGGGHDLQRDVGADALGELPAVNA